MSGHPRLHPRTPHQYPPNTHTPTKAQLGNPGAGPTQVREGAEARTQSSSGPKRAFATCLPTLSSKWPSALSPPPPHPHPPALQSAPVECSQLPPVPQLEIWSLETGFAALFTSPRFLPGAVVPYLRFRPPYHTTRAREVRTWLPAKEGKPVTAQGRGEEDPWIQKLSSLF